MAVYTRIIVPAPEFAHLLGRNVEHDDRSRTFALTGPATVINPALWTDKRIRIYDPIPNPKQVIGNCTMCAKAMQCNAAGNRVVGRVLGMKWATNKYVWETANDEFPGAYKLDGTGQDTGSSGLASCKTAQHFSVGGTYRFLFGGADEVVQKIQNGRVVNVGTNWYESMFTNPYSVGKRVTIAGGIVGGHEYTLHGYWKARDWVLGRCWWGSYKDFWISRADLNRLLHEEGDAHTQRRLQPV